MLNIKSWIDKVFSKDIPTQVVAICFNLYEDADNQWSIEMVGTSSFDTEDSDWACDEVFDTRDDLQSWGQESSWEEIQQNICEQIKEYLISGMYSEKMKRYVGIGVGFVDGDINVIYQR